MKKLFNLINQNTKLKIRRFLIGKEKLEIISSLRFHFESYHHGYGDYEWYGFNADDCNWVELVKPVREINIEKFRIYSIKVKINKNYISMDVTLERPGIFIGKGGRDIVNLTKYLSKNMDKEVRIYIHERRGVWEDQNPFFNIF